MTDQRGLDSFGGRLRRVVTSPSPSYMAHVVAVEGASKTLCGQPIRRGWLVGRVLVRRECETCESMQVRRGS